MENRYRVISSTWSRHVKTLPKKDSYHCFSAREVSSPQSWRHRATALWTGSALNTLGLAALLGRGRARRPPRCGCGARMGRLRPAEMQELEEGQQAATWWQHNGEPFGKQTWQSKILYQWGFDGKIIELKSSS